MALQTREETVSLQLGFVKVRQSALDAIKESTGKTDAEVGPVLNSYTSQYLTELGRGGVLLSGQQVAQIEKTTGKEITGPEDIVKGLQKAANRDEGLFCVTARIDPAYYESVKQAAEWRGVTEQELLEDCLNTALGNSWLESWEPSGGTVRLDRKDWEKAQKATGKALPLGADIAKVLKMPDTV